MLRLDQKKFRSDDRSTVSLHGGHTTCERANKLDSVEANTEDRSVLESKMILTRLLAINIFTSKKNNEENKQSIETRISCE